MGIYCLHPLQSYLKFECNNLTTIQHKPENNKNTPIKTTTKTTTTTPTHSNNNNNNNNNKKEKNNTNIFVYIIK